MSNGFAKAQAMGNLGKAPEVRFSTGGTAVANLSVGCNYRVKKGDAWEDAVEWVRVVCFGKTAEAAGQHLDKGSQVYVSGRLQTREWEDKDGNRKFSTEVVADEVIFLGGKKDGTAKPTGKPAAAQQDDDGIPF